MSGLQHFGEIIAGGYYQRIPQSVRIDKVRSWLRAMNIILPDEFAPVLARCESGPEARLLWEFCTRPGVRVVCDDVLGIPPFAVFPQYEWSRYRLDFYLEREGRALAVEVDGFAFHNATPEQVQADYTRERQIVVGLCPVMRFTAREIFADAAACWSEIDAFFTPTEGPTRV